MLKKAQWIAETLSLNEDDVHDVLLGNIMKPEDFVNEVEAAGRRYNEERKFHSI